MPRAEAEAQRLRRELGADSELAIDVHAIAASLEAGVVYERLPSDVSGMLVRDNESIVIGVNESHSPSRQRFTIAHELGHLVMHRGRPLVVDSARVNMRDSRSSMATDLEEIEANSFAAGATDAPGPRTDALP